MKQIGHCRTVTAALSLTLAAGLAAAAPTAYSNGNVKPSGKTSVLNFGPDGTNDNTDPVGPDRPTGYADYLLSNPNAVISPAIRVFSRDAVGFPTRYIMGFAVRNKILVKTDSLSTAATTIADVANSMGLTVQISQVPTVDGYLEVTTATAGNAMDFRVMLDGKPGIISAGVDAKRPNVAEVLPTDPLVSDQWHFEPMDGGVFGLDLSPVYDRGITGLGITVGILETGEEPPDARHPDLAGSFDLSGSQAIEVNFADITVPNAQLNPHGTAVAGIISAAGNNGTGGAGVAYNSEFIHLRNGFDREVGEALTFRLGNVPVRNNSWGPVLIGGGLIIKDYIDIDTPFPADSLKFAAERGRSGKGVINVRSAGNDNYDPTLELDGNGTALIAGGAYRAMGLVLPAIPDRDDFILIGARTEYQPWLSNIYTITVGAAGEDGLPAPYSRPGNAVLISAPSAGGTGTRGITTTDIIDDGGYVAGDYVSDFGGTSAAAPMVTGVIALMLEANPDLNLRDVKHILKRSAVLPDSAYTPGLPYFPGDNLNALLVGDPTADPITQPVTNNGGFTKHHDQLGFGILNADRAVAMAAGWNDLPPQITLDTGFRSEENGNFSDGAIPDAQLEETGENYFTLVPGASLIEEICVRPDIKIEWIEVTLNVEGAWVGDLEITLTSPFGTTSYLAMPRYDVGKFVDGDYSESVFISYKHWDEFAGGEWDLVFTDYIPDDDPPEIPEEPSMDDPPPTIDTGLSPYYYFNLTRENPSSEEKTLVSYRVRIFGYDVGNEPFRGCTAASDSCPGDFDGDGDIDREDFLDFLRLWEVGDPAADLDNDGLFSYNDILLFYGSFRPGFCTPAARPGFFPWGRPTEGVNGNEIPIG